MLELNLVVSDFFAEMDDSFRMLEEYFFILTCYLQCSSYRYDSEMSTSNMLSITLLSLSNQ
jgi:hypothetical protein